MLHKKVIAAAFVASTVIAVTPATAALVFETHFDDYVVDSAEPNGGAGYDILDTIEGWTEASGDGIEVQNGVAGDAFSPLNLVELDSNNNSSMDRTIATGTYDLSFYYSPRPGIAPASNGIDVLVGGLSVYNVTGQGGANTMWNLQTVRIRANGPTNLKFAAIGTSDSLGGYVDSISLSTAVPEPATWAMLIGGFGIVGGAMRRRSRMTVKLA